MNMNNENEIRPNAIDTIQSMFADTTKFAHAINAEPPKNMVEFSNSMLSSADTFITASTFAAQQNYTTSLADWVVKLGGALSKHSVISQFHEHQNKLFEQQKKLAFFVGKAWVESDALNKYQTTIRNFLNSTSNVNSKSSLYETLLKVQDINKDYQKNLAIAFKPISQVISSTNYQQYANILNSAFVKGLIDISNHPTLSESFLRLNDILNDIVPKQDSDDAVPIQDMLTVAINADLVNAEVANSDIPATLIQEGINEIITTIDHNISLPEIWERLKNQSWLKKSHILIVVCWIIKDIVLNHHVTKIYTDLIGDDSEQTLINSGNTLSFDVVKYLKSEPNLNSNTICKIPCDTYITIKEENNGWIFISFVSDGIYIEGWTTNDSIKKS